MKEKVVLDTDIGSDIDDAICLAYLLSHPDCEIIGITTVSGHPERRAMITDYLCEKAKKNIPVYPGMSEPLIGQQKQKTVAQFEYLESIGFERSFEKDWFCFLAKTIRKNPGEINLITIGPLTNIGTLFKIDPELPLFLKAIYIMGGMFFGETKKAEWNISCDPYAAHSVFTSNAKNIFVCGLDVTTKVMMKRKEVVELFSKNFLLKEVLNFAEIWFRNRDIITFHDPLAASVLFKKDMCRFKKGKIFVDQIGVTGFIEDKSSNTYVASELEPDGFFAHFFDIFSIPYPVHNCPIKI